MLMMKQRVLNRRHSSLDGDPPLSKTKRWRLVEIIEKLSNYDTDRITSYSSRQQRC